MFSPTSQSLNALENQYSSGVYVKRDLQIVRGEGATLYDAEGRAYIDFISGQGSTNLGHNHPTVVSAVQNQVTTLMSCPELLHNPVRAQYQAKLCHATRMERVFLCNSGAEAVEAALKFAVYSTGRRRIISMMRGFHGRTLGALSTTWNRHYREPFSELLPSVEFVPFNNLARLQQSLAKDVAAVVLEPIQGEGGIYPAEEGYLTAVQDLCHANGSLLIMDEIQTGFGRTGTLFAHQQDDIQPDLLCLAKSIANGLPMGAVLIGERVGEFAPAIHGSTFGGNPVSCSAGLAVLDTLENSEIIDNARIRGEAIIQHLRENLPASIVREVRGRGFMIGIELRTKVAPILEALQVEGVLALPAGRTVLRLLPPLVINDDELWQAVAIIERVLHDATA